MNMNKKLVFILLALAFIVVVSCKQETGIKFNHKFHIEENDMSCEDCHTLTDGKMSLPSMDKCSECHDIDVDNPSEECLLCHTPQSAKEDYSIEQKALPKSYADVTFSHEFHEGIECNSCHKGIENSTDLKSITVPKMPVCLECHNDEEAPKSCDTCHKEIRKDVPPASHKGDWAQWHGKEADFDKAVCLYCHQKNMCSNCHQTQKPRDHLTFVWKTEDHGVEATHDRRKCAECHTAGYCSDCHRQKPPSHKRGDWMAFDRHNGHAEAARRNFRSCKVCHETAECAKCHQTIIMRQP
ncbi:MAG: hypothetical protein GXO20_08140 [Thermodesulfobacteria bacterium]|nr:hypothetical protein [Thermodesulfobacteriota bacterium]